MKLILTPNPIVSVSIRVRSFHRKLGLGLCVKEVRVRAILKKISVTSSRKTLTCSNVMP